MVLAAFLAWSIGSAAAAGEAAPVRVATAELRSLVDAVHLSGTVVAPRASSVSTSVGGLVERMAVDLGDRVDAGAIIVQLDHALAQHEVAQADAALAEAEAELAERRRRLDIALRLSKPRYMPKDELDTRKTQVRVGVAVLAKLKAEAAYQHERLRRHTVNAPFEGIVAQKLTEAGEWISPGAPIVELVATSDLRVDIPVPQQFYPRLTAETPVVLRFDALPGERFDAVTVAVVPISDRSARTFTLRVRPVGAGVPLTPGMSVRAVLNFAAGERGIVIPRDAVIRYPDGRTTAWVVGGEPGSPIVDERRVELGQAFEGHVHVTTGLAAGDLVVVAGNESLRPRQRVRVLDRAS
jgi:RND family efflux transporter MFP subunit